MRKIITTISKTTKIILVLLGIVVLQKVNATSNVDKISNESMNKTLDLTAMAIKLNEIEYNDKYAALDTFTGDLTGYAANCPLCNGHLGCTGADVRDGTTSYMDKTYGKVAIVASSKNLACGSIVRFKSKSVSNEEVYAIVLDRGVLGTDLDLLVESESYARSHVGRRKISYDVLRFGWTRES